MMSVKSHGAFVHISLYSTMALGYMPVVYICQKKP